MMKVNELRCGNFIENEMGHIIEVNYNTLCNMVEFDAVYKPIILTSKLLLSFGFTLKNDVSGMFYEKDKNRVYLIGNEFEFEYYTFPNQKRFNLFKTFKYVHTLQNLYFSLTGIELGI